MSLDTNVINLAINGKYTDFSNAVKAELHSKLSQNDSAKSYANEYDKIQQMKVIFAKINSTEDQKI